MKYLILLLLTLTACGTDNPSYSLAPEPVLAPVTTTVKFCASQVVSYPTSFPEFGLCIDNKIYAVYFDTHNAWWSEIPPGNYRTTSTGLICNFTVYNNCVVQEN